jgi:large subunit ribosomal protein L29
MKFSDLKERKSQDLTELKTSLTRDVFKSRMKNAVGQLEDTSSIKKARKDIARINTILNQRPEGGQG